MHREKSSLLYKYAYLSADPIIPVMILCNKHFIAKDFSLNILSIIIVKGSSKLHNNCIQENKSKNESEPN